MSMHLLSSHFNADKLLLSHFNADKLPIISRPITFGLIPNFLFLSSFTCMLEIELMQSRLKCWLLFSNVEICMKTTKVGLNVSDS